LDDPRRILDEAVTERRPCRVARLRGEWQSAALVRLESAGVVCNVPGHAFRGGEEVRLWFEDASGSLHFEASVLRVGVPVPDRGAAGVLLGFLAASAAAPVPAADPVPAPAASAAPQPQRPVLDLVLATGAPISLLSPPIRLVEVAIDHVSFEVPRNFTVMFPDNGTLWLRIGASTAESTDARGRVRLVAGDAVLLYRVEIEQVEHQDRHQNAIPVLAAL
jgi:hypothetical protein